MRRATVLWLVIAGLLPNAEPSLFSQADAMLEKVSEIMGLPVRRKVNKQMTTREQVEAYLRAQVGRQYPGEELGDLSRALGVLGLLPEGYDLAGGVIDMLTDQVAGYYDPEKKIFYVAEWVPESLQLPTMAHELAHVLQDQHYDLAPMMQPTRGEQDADLAFQAVLEGQGVAVMTEVLIGPTGMSLKQVGAMMGAMGDVQGLLATAGEAMGFDTGGLAQTPPYLLRSMMFPYNDGFQFYLAFLEKHSWADAGMLFRRRPVSSEEILHPEKYLAGGDPPEPVEADDLAAALPEGWRVLFRERLGEFTLREMLAVRLESAVAAAAAAGWDGDRTLVAVDASGARSMMLQRSAWDSEDDAREYFQAAVKLMRARHPDATPLDHEKDRLAAWATGAGGVRVWREGSLVGILEGAPSSMWMTLFTEAPASARCGTRWPAPAAPDAR